MEERTWTEEQLAAIESRNKTLLVSAAAGSGKTSTLTERIIRRLKDPEDPISLDEVLIVTFTDAAAADLRSKISRALRDAVNEDPTNKRLNRELLRLESADISTISSFCLNLVKRNFQFLGLPANISVMDDAECRLLEEQEMGTLIEDAFNGRFSDAESADFSITYLSDLFGNVRNQNALTQTFLRIHAVLCNHPLREKMLLVLADQAKEDGTTDFLKTESGKYLSYTALQSLYAYSELVKRCLAYLQTEPEYCVKWAPAFYSDDTLINEFIALLNGNSYDDLRKFCASLSFKKLDSVTKNFFTVDGKACQGAREKYKTEIMKLAKRFLTSEDEIASTFSQSAEILYQLYAFFVLYESRLYRKKLQKRSLGFSDIEHNALQLLFNTDTNTVTDTAIRLREHYKEVYIDEYQDVNLLQDLIFSSIANRDNRFMVGDMKQCIYAFRGATPELFLGYRKRFGLDTGDGKTLFLSKNFRSEPHILGFCNDLFNVLFPIVSPRMEYRAEDRLNYPDQQTEPNGVVSLSIFTKPEDDTQSPEADYVAAKIADLIAHGRKKDGSEIHAKDICILLRSNAGTGELFRQALMRRGIACANQSAGDFFRNPEVLLMLSLLHVINNPYEDIHLIGVLKSPLFHVNADELIYIRKQRSNVPFYTALKEFTETTGFAKGVRFLEVLSRYQELSRTLPTDRLLWYLICDTDMFSILYARDPSDAEGEDPTPEQMRANLLLLYEYARRFENSSFDGLFSFVRYVDALIEQNQKIELASLTSEGDDAVRIMTVHHSKGLEFPVCFLSNLGKQFNESDLKKNPIYHRDIGIGIMLRSESGFEHYSTKLLEAVKEAVKASDAEEEARVLYVALTRAKEQLYLTATAKDPEKEVEEAKSKYVSGIEKLKSAKTPLQWILNTNGIRQNQYLEILIDPKCEVQTDAMQKKCEDVSCRLDYFAYKKEISDRIGFDYYSKHPLQLPAKLSVSELYPGILDEEFSAYGLNQNAADVSDDGETLDALYPAFLNPDEGVSAARKGTATHVFLQFCDFGALLEYGAEHEIKRLLENKYMTSEDVLLIRRDWIEQFTKSSLFSQILTASKVYREKRFHTLIGADTLTEDPEMKEKLKGQSVLVQGVIDCFFRSAGNQWTVVDYKTDSYVPARDGDKEAFCEELAERYRTQLGYYRIACQKMTGCPVDRVLIHSFALNRDITLFGKDDYHD